jgi:AraC-like DNA-binding protein
MSVYAPMLGTLWQAVRSYGHDPASVIDAELYRPERWPPVPERISFQDYDAAISRAIALIDDPTAGLRSAQYCHPSHLGAVGGAWLASRSLRSAMLLAERFTRTYHDELELRIEELPDRVRAVYRMLTPHTFPDIMGDSFPAALFTLCNANLGRKLVPLEVTLARSRPADPGPWNDFFGIEVRFGQPHNSLSISLEDADLPLTGGNPDLVAVHEDIMQEHLLKLDRDNPIYRARLSIMKQLPSGRVTADRLARSLNMSKRTLQRKLGEHDQTVRSLLTQVRKDLAERYIRGGKYSITEIAFLLGFADTSAFSRAFKSWFGQSPKQARESER